MRNSLGNGVGHPGFIGVVVLGLVLWAGPVGAEAPANRSLKDSEDKTESVKTLTREQLEAQVKNLSDSLALANAESDFFRQQWQNLRLRDEALGVDALTVDEKRLEDRVVQAVKELYQTEKQRRAAVRQLQELLEASQKLVKTASQLDPQRRADYEVAVRSSREFLEGKGEGPIPLATSLMDGQIVSMNPKLNSVVINVGSEQGVKAGMPFRVLRNDQVIGTIKVFQVREQVSAALVENLDKVKELKLGDRVSVAAEK